jgi:subtilisin family serine protease
MMRDGLLLVALFVFGTVGIEKARSQSDWDEYVTIRTTSGISDDVIQYIARNSELAALDLHANEKPEDLIRSVCGVFTDAYGKVFFGEWNTSLSADAAVQRRSVKVPACPKWERDIAVIVLPGDTLDTVVARKIGDGITKDDVLTCPAPLASQRCGKTYRALIEQANPGTNLDQLTNVKSLIFPIVTYEVTFLVRKGSGLSADQVVSKIKELAAGSGTSAALLKTRVEKPVDLVYPVRADSPVAQSDKACISPQSAKPAGAGNVPWPYDAQIVASVLSRTLRAAGDANRHPTTQTVVVIDTGVDDVNSFPVDMLARDRSNAVLGSGIQRRKNYQPYPDDEYGMHGTQVAHIMAGSSGLRSSLQQMGIKLSDLLRISPINVRQRKDASPFVSYDIRAGGVDTAISFALSNASLANLSIGSPEPFDLAIGNIKAQPKLFVVAAGNDRHNLTGTSYYLADYGGTFLGGRSHVITVGAHDGAGQPAPFSNWSDNYVDLFAPGCAVPYLGPETGAGEHGTSFAAPIVSMTAALLLSLGVAVDDVKNRLYASVDLDPALEKYASSSGRLNLPKAVALYDDALQRRSSSPLIFGEAKIGRILSCQEGDLDTSNIAKITATAVTPSIKLRILWTDINGVLRTAECTPTTQSLDFQDRVNNNTIKVDWSDFVDLVPRYFQ